LPPGLRSLINEQMTVDSLGTGDAKKIFTNIFKKNWWNNDESRSGWGAELKRTESIRINLADFARRHALGSLLDAPCGDYNWMQHVEWPAGFRYVGADIVHDLIIENRENHPGIEFMELDVLKDSLPHVDAWLARDLMIPDQAIWTALEQFRRVDRLSAGDDLPPMRGKTPTSNSARSATSTCARHPSACRRRWKSCVRTTIRSPVGSLPSGGDRTSNKFWKQRTPKSKGNKL
jgi:hypothetical protein